MNRPYVPPWVGLFSPRRPDSALDANNVREYVSREQRVVRMYSCNGTAARTETGIEHIPHALKPAVANGVAREGIGPTVRVVLMMRHTSVCTMTSYHFTTSEDYTLRKICHMQPPEDQVGGAGGTIFPRYRKEYVEEGSTGAGTDGCVAAIKSDRPQHRRGWGRRWHEGNSCMLHRVVGRPLDSIVVEFVAAISTRCNVDLNVGVRISYDHLSYQHVNPCQRAHCH